MNTPYEQRTVVYFEQLAKRGLRVPEWHKLQEVVKAAKVPPEQYETFLLGTMVGCGLSQSGSFDGSIMQQPNAFTSVRVQRAEPVTTIPPSPFTVGKLEDLLADIAKARADVERVRKSGSYDNPKGRPEAIAAAEAKVAALRATVLPCVE